MTVCSHLDCGLGDPGYSGLQVTGVSTCPHHDLKGFRFHLVDKVIMGSLVRRGKQVSRTNELVMFHGMMLGEIISFV